MADSTQILAERITKLSAEVKELGEDDKQVLALVAFLCDALCEATPQLREKLLSITETRLDEDFDRGDPRAASRARTLHYGLNLLLRRLGDERSYGEASDWPRM